jgi:hypothetical protein
MKTGRPFLLRLAQYGDGARASARFNIQKHEARDLPSLLEVCTLKRRKRCAPVPLNAAVLLFVLAGGSLGAQTNPNALPPLAPAYGVMPPTFLEQYGMAALAAGLVLLVLAGVAGWLLLRPKPPLVVPPAVTARLALAEWRQRPEDGLALSEISQILRRYLVAAGGLPPGEQTTTDFAAAIANHAVIGAERAQAIVAFLRECDRRKFAPQAPDQPLDAAGRALEIVGQMEAQRAKAAVPA